MEIKNCTHKAPGHINIERWAIWSRLIVQHAHYHHRHKRKTSFLFLLSFLHERTHHRTNVSWILHIQKPANMLFLNIKTTRNIFTILMHSSWNIRVDWRKCNEANTYTRLMAWLVSILPTSGVEILSASIHSLTYNHFYSAWHSACRARCRVHTSKRIKVHSTA